MNFARNIQADLIVLVDNTPKGETLSSSIKLLDKNKLNYKLVRKYNFCNAMPRLISNLTNWILARLDHLYSNFLNWRNLSFKNTIIYVGSSYVLYISFGDILERMLKHHPHALTLITMTNMKWKRYLIHNTNQANWTIWSINIKYDINEPT